MVSITRLVISVFDQWLNSFSIYFSVCKYGSVFFTSLKRLHSKCALVISVKVYFNSLRRGWVNISVNKSSLGFVLMNFCICSRTSDLIFSSLYCRSMNGNFQSLTFVDNFTILVLLGCGLFRVGEMKWNVRSACSWKIC